MFRMRLFRSIGLLSLVISQFAMAHDSHSHTAGLVHLVFSESAVHAHLTWKQGPTSEGESVLRLEWKRAADHAAIEAPGPFKVSLFMPSMGHGSAPTQITQLIGADGKVELGSYQVSDLFFTMHGEWRVDVALKTASGTEIKSFTVQIGSSDGHHH